MLYKYRGTLAHCAISFVFCISGLGWYAVLFFVGRELAQAEYRYIATYGGKRADCPWYCGFLLESWTLKGFLDWLLPVMIAVVYSLLESFSYD
jgi:hypothetical protein